MATTASAQRNRQTTVAIAGLLGAGVFGPSALAQIVELLDALVPPTPRPTAAWLAHMAAGADVAETLSVAEGPAQAIERENAAGWLALYLVAAAGRLTDAATESAEASAAARVAELRYFAGHVAAERRRLRAAAAQDAMASLVPTTDRTRGLLGWRAVLDTRTTAACRWAHGKNFRADEMPSIGWPGAVHRACRCSAGPPIPGAPLIPSV